MADFLGMLRFIIWIDLSTDFSSYQIILKLSQLVTIMLTAEYHYAQRRVAP